MAKEDYFLWQNFINHILEEIYVKNKAKLEKSEMKEMALDGKPVKRRPHWSKRTPV